MNYVKKPTRWTLTTAQQASSNSHGTVRDLIRFYLLWQFAAFLSPILFLLFGYGILPDEFFPLTRPYFTVISALLVLIFVIWYLKRFTRMRGIAFRERFYLDMDGKLSARAICFGIVTFFLSLYHIYSFQAVGIPVKPNFHHRYGLFLAALFICLIIAPCEEELAVRGFAYPILRDRYGVMVGIIICSLLFSLLHIFNYFTVLSISNISIYASTIYFLNYMLFGILYNIVLEVEGDLKWCIFFHWLSALFIFSIAFIM